MKPEDTRPDDAAEGGAWLDGLAGRGGASSAARDGARLRDALKPDEIEPASISAPLWQDIVAAARPPLAPAAPQTKRAAANDSRWRRVALGALAAAVIAAGLWTQRSREDSASSVMRGSANSRGAQWRTPNPGDTARALAQRLEAAGASVTVTPLDQGVRLDIACAPSACTGVNELLVGLETAVDSNGRLALQVLPPN